MYRVMYKDAYHYVADRDGVFYYVRRVPHDVRQHYASSRISFSLRTKSHQSALRAAKSVTQRLEDYWLGLRLQQMDIPAIHLVKTDDVENASPLMMDAVEMIFPSRARMTGHSSVQPDAMVSMCPRYWAIDPSLLTHHQRLLSSETGALSKA